MRDFRALRNLKNLNSYRAWEGESLRRSGFSAILVANALLVIAFVWFVTRVGPGARDGRDWAVLMATNVAVYLLVTGGLMLFAILRWNAWRRAHPWTPPSPGRGAAP